MIPLKLTLEGFLSYRDETVVDFSEIEVACISGPNGAGKSTLFDAITWALFGKARRNDDDALINDALKKYDKGSCRVALEFDYESGRYRVERTKERGKGVQLEFQMRAQSGEWKPLTEAGVRATDERIRRTLHLDYDTFINSVFFLQGKADLFTQQIPARRKEILGSILGLEVWEVYRDEAARRRRACENDLSLKQQILNEILAELEQEPERRDKLALLTQTLEKTAALRLEKEQLWNKAQADYQQVTSDQEKLALLSARLESDRRRQAELTEQEKQRRAELDAGERILQQTETIMRAYQAWQAQRTELEEWDQLAGRYHAIQTDLSRFETELKTEEARLLQERRHLQEREAEVLKISRLQASLRAEIIAEQQRLDDLENRLLEIPALEEKLSTLQSRNSELRAENLRLKDSMDQLKKDIEALKAAGGSQCPLCGQTLTDEHRRSILGQMDRTGKNQGDRYRENSRELRENEQAQAECKDRLSVLRKDQNELAFLQRNRGQKEQRLADYTEALESWQSREEPRLKELEALLERNDFSAEVRVQLQQTQTSLQALGYQPEEHERRRQAEREARKVEETYRKLEAARAAADSLRRELATLEANRAVLAQEIAQNESLHKEIRLQLEARQSALPNVEAIKADLENLNREENSLRQQVGAARQMVDVLESQRRRHVSINEEIAAVKAQIADLKALELAFGKDGIPALLIEQALPQIETQANEILDRLSDGRMSIAFLTEREYKDKKREDKKQTLDILISDSAGQREYELFSGGEAFRINFAIRLALSRVLAQRAGARLQTLVIDEGFGSQDAEGRQRLIEAINLVSRDFAKILVITHLDELKDAFPSRIEVQKTLRGSTVEVMP
ncbi:MAG: SMC family ATPase [Anaerolineae bacterium]|nr:SMC family ATPase [Anaerolineae bacterium]